MNEERLLKVILAPYVSEKATILSGINQYTFKVLQNATKTEIKKATEKLFNVTVENVTTINVKGKKKIFGKILGRRKSWKKAHVTLKEGDRIEMFGAE